jgi:DNA-binding transcriptional MerR regulator
MTPDKSPSALRTIGEVAEDVGVATHVLRFWESKFNQIKPQKRRGRRYYRPEDVRTITQIKSLLYVQGYTIRGVQKFLSAESKNRLLEKQITLPAFKEEKPTISAQVAPQAVIQPVPQAEVKTSLFETDLFGNLIITNPPVINAQPKTPEVTESFSKRFSDSNMLELENIYNGLISARKKLTEPA